MTVFQHFICQIQHGYIKLDTQRFAKIRQVIEKIGVTAVKMNGYYIAVRFNALYYKRLFPVQIADNPIPATRAKPGRKHDELIVRCKPGLYHFRKVLGLLAGLIDRNTIVIFTSDNGPHHEGGADPDFFKSYGPFRGIKRDVYEGGIRIPMVAWCPGTIKAGAQSDHISAFWDVMPTLAELTGTVLPEKTDGISFLPTLLSKKDQQAHDYLYWEFHELNGREALRSGKWKLIRQPIVGETILELYDLSNDIHEDTNLAEKYPDKVKELAVLMDNARIESPYFNFGREK